MSIVSRRIAGATALLLATSVFAATAPNTPDKSATPAAPKPHAAGGKAAMRSRCLAAIAESGESAAAKPSAENAYDAGPGNYLFEFKQPDGGSFFCQVCDDLDDRTQCGSLGLMLNHRPAQGEARQLPAELDRKCVYFLQKELGPSGSMVINQSLVAKIKVTPMHTDARWVFRMDLDPDEYRCVIRKSDGNFLVEKHKGSEWKPLATGIMF